MTGTMNRETNQQQLGKPIAGAMMFFGIALIVFGIIAVVMSVFFTVGTVVLLGGLLLAAGIFEFVHALRAHGRKRIFLNMTSALLYLIVGGVILWNPIAGAVSLTLLMSVFFIVAGVLRCAYGVAHREQRSWGWFIFGGLVDIALGALIAVGWPGTGLWVIGLFIGIEMLMYGTTLTILSVEYKSLERRLTG